MSCSRASRIICRGVTKIFTLEGGDMLEVLHGLSFTASRSECWAFQGPNGSGKSTLLKIIAGLESPSRGVIDIGTDCELAYLTQGVAEYAGRDLTVCEQMNLGRIACSVTWKAAAESLSSREARNRARMLLSQLGMNLERRLDDYMRSLSGGQVQAVMLAAVIGGEPPDILLLDEHSTALDHSVRLKIIEWLRTLVVGHSVTILFVTHEQDLIAEMAARVITMEPAKLICHRNDGAMSAGGQG